MGPALQQQARAAINLLLERPQFHKRTARYKYSCHRSRPSTLHRIFPPHRRRNFTAPAVCPHAPVAAPKPRGIDHELLSCIPADTPSTQEEHNSGWIRGAWIPLPEHSASCDRVLVSTTSFGISSPKQEKEKKHCAGIQPPAVLQRCTAPHPYYSCRRQRRHSSRRSSSRPPQKRAARCLVLS